MIALTTNKTLHTLLLNDCNISGFGASNIGNNIQDVTSLTHLDISNNNITATGKYLRIFYS